ncbi:MAG: DUF4421 domain-containing protein [Spirochaetaceae bacterium]|nr:DUF4421 domain-containing protein [Spirochaetaceae bacterium]
MKYYEGFHSETLTLTGAESGGEVDLKIILAGLSGAYIFNPDHSLRSVYNLDRKQRTSNASLLVGAGGFYSALYADNGPPNSGNQLTLYFGPNAGYSYIWILKNNFFINLLGILGVNGSVKNGEFYLGFSGLPKFALGWHGKDWSFNAVLSNTLLLAMKKMKFDNIINSGTFSITFSKRF